MRLERNHSRWGFAFLVLAALSRPSFALEASPPVPLWFACEADWECEVTQADACGCALGGQAVAVNTRYVDRLILSYRKKACPGGPSLHWTCTAEAKRRCQNRECQLVRVPPADGSATKNALLACEAIADESGQDFCIRQAAAKLPDYNECTRLKANRGRHQCVQAVWEQLDSRKPPGDDVCARVPQVSADFCPTTRDTCAIAAAPKAGLSACAVVSCPSALNSCVAAAGLPAQGPRREEACRVVKKMNQARPTLFTGEAGSLSPDFRGYVAGCGIRIP